MIAQRAPIGRRVAAGRVRPGGAQGRTNVGDVERLASVVGGGLLALFGIREGKALGLGLAAAGAALLYRGLSGHCHVYDALGMNTAEHHSQAASVAAGKGVRVVHTVTIDRPAEDLYLVWRNFEDLPHFMRHLVSVREEGQYSYWKARGPAGTTVDWTAEVVNDRPNHLIAWRSLEGSSVNTAGSVRFTPAPGGGTQVRVELKYDPPAGKLGSWVAWAFGQDPDRQVRDDLERFKQLMEIDAGAAVSRR